MAGISCEYLDSLEVKIPDKYVYKEDEKPRTIGVYFRKYQFCRQTLCCETSPDKFTSQLVNKTEQPVINSAEPGDIGPAVSLIKHLFKSQNYGSRQTKSPGRVYPGQNRINTNPKTGAKIQVGKCG